MYYTITVRTIGIDNAIKEYSDLYYGAHETLDFARKFTSCKNVIEVAAVNCYTGELIYCSKSDDGYIFDPYNID